MTSLASILQLDKTQASIKKIDLFLTKQVKLSDEYMIALAYKASILHSLNKSNEALKLILPFINDFKIMSANAVVAVCDSIIEIYLDDLRFDEANKYINLKKNYLPASRLHLYLKDRIKLYLKMNDNKKAKEALEAYLSDDLMRDEAMEARKSLADIYLYEKQYDKYLELAKILESYYSENVYLDDLAELELNRLSIAFDRKNYLKVIADGNKFLEVTSRVDYILRCAAICIRAYIELDDYKKASIFESYYEDYATDEHLNEALEFSYAALDLYTKTNSLVSINEYKNRIERLESRLEPKRKKTKPKKAEAALITTDLNNIDFTRPEGIIEGNNRILNPKEIEYKERVSVVPKPKDIKGINVSKEYEALIKIIRSLNEMDSNTKFREIFRKSFILIKKEFHIDEAYLLYYRGKYNGLYFKSDRAYDRKIEFSDIEETISYAAMQFDDDIILDRSKDSYNINIVDNKEYNDGIYAISIPLHNSLEVIGSITYYSSENISENSLLYEAIKLISELINDKLLASFKEMDNELHNQKLYFLKDNMSSGLKELRDDYIHLNPRAMEIFGSMENLTMADFYMNMKNEDITVYKNKLDEIYKALNTNVVFEYDYKKNDKFIRVRERFYPINIDGTIHITSLIDDISSDYRDKEALISLAYKNPLSGMESEAKLLVDLKHEIPSFKLSLAVVELNDFSLYTEIYGKRFSNQLIYALGLSLREASSNDFNASVYHLDRDRFAILFRGLNDKRLIDSRLKLIFLSAAKALHKLNKRVNASFNAGVYRLGQSSKECEDIVILENALEALSDSYLMDTIYPHIAHYNTTIAKERLKRSMLVTHISEAIDSNNIALTYQQIVDLKNNEVYGYNAIINLDNFEIDRAYMDLVIDRRGLRKRVDKYSINRLFMEERMLYEELKGYIPMFLEISTESIDERLYDYISTLANHYKIDKKYIVFVLDNINSNSIIRLRQDGFRLASKNILDAFKNSCDYLIYNYSDEIEEIIELCHKHNIILITSNVNTKDEVVNAKEKGYSLIYGSYYKKLNRIGRIIEKIVK